MTSDGYCRGCLRYMFGSDEAEEIVVTSMIEGVVTGALNAHVSSDLIMLAVHRAIEKDRRRQEGAMFEMLTEGRR